MLIIWVNFIEKFLRFLDERERLIYERNNLLKSGIYSEEDPLIKELDR